MKQCPQCKRNYSDEDQFCYEDGTVLVVAGSFENPSYSGDVPTIVVPKTENPQIQTPPQFQVPNISPTVQTNSTGKWVFPVLGLLLGVIVVLGFLLFYRNPTPQSENKSTEVAQNKGNSNQAAEKKETPAPTVTQAQTPTATPKPTVVQNQTVTTRMKFNKGEITHNESGNISANGKRIFLLKCLDGQSLSASVSSDNNCVTFDNNSSNLSYITSAGDNRISLKNSCEATRFRVSVTIY